MMSKKQIQEWLDSLPDEVQGIGIDGGGLSLIAVTSRSIGPEYWLEVGGIPEPDDEGSSSCVMCEQCGGCGCIIGEEDHQDDCPNREPVTAVELLRSAVDHWAGRFESDEDINGADCVDWLAYFIGQATEIVKREKP